MLVIEEPTARSTTTRRPCSTTPWVASRRAHDHLPGESSLDTAHVDRVFVLKDGHLEASGTHSEFWQSIGLYRRLQIVADGILESPRSHSGIDFSNRSGETDDGPRVRTDGGTEAAGRPRAPIRREYEAFTPIPDAPVTITTHADRASQELILKYLHAVSQDARVRRNRPPHSKRSRNPAARVGRRSDRRHSRFRPKDRPVLGDDRAVRRWGTGAGVVPNRPRSLHLRRLVGGCWTRVSDRPPPVAGFDSGKFAGWC